MYNKDFPAWENDDIQPGSIYCPDCDAYLDQHGFGSNCEGYHESDCDTCMAGSCDLSC